MRYLETVPKGAERPAGEHASALGHTIRSTTSIGISTAGLVATLGAITMLFVGFTSAYLVRRAGSDWSTVPMPQALWFTTAVLLLGSLTLEWARGSAKHGRMEAVRVAVWATLGLGVLFVSGQFLAWTQLVKAGFFLASGPHSSFFYVLTGAHGLHVLGGMVALLLGLRRVSTTSDVEQARSAVSLTATYWHFMDGLWLYLFALLFFV